MSNKLNLSVTRSNLLRLREELDFAQEGYELLEQKREVLVMEVMSLIEKLREWKKQAETSLQAAYRALEEANIVLGKESVTRASLAIQSVEKIRVRERSIMGVSIPQVAFSRCQGPCHHQYGFAGTSPSLDKAVYLFSSALEKLAKLAEAEVSLFRLATELKKTQRRANSLHYMFIPEYRETIRYLENTLEEKEREEFFQLKRAKESHQKQVE
ncbi:MAG: V-type ATP synthase subunit D [bacterium]